MPLKASAARRHRIPGQRHRVTNWTDYDAALRQRGSLTVRFTDEAVARWMTVHTKVACRATVTRSGSDAGNDPDGLVVHFGPPDRVRMTSRFVVRSTASRRSLMISAKASIFPMTSVKERTCLVAFLIAAAAASVTFTRVRDALKPGWDDVGRGLI